MDKYKPEVGEECEFSQANGSWERINPKFVGGSFCIADIEGVGEVSILISHSTFRPIRTQGELEREDAIDHIHELARGAYSLPNKAMGRAVYDTGYRLVGEKVDYAEIRQKWIESSEPSFVVFTRDNYDIYRKVEK